MIEKNQNINIEIKQLSEHLFWDVDKTKIDLEKNKIWFIHRILEYGLLKDWHFILKKYGIKEIANIAVNLKDLDKKTVSLISVLSGVPKENFLCYNTEVSNQKHWNF
jgi:hypothetical protein